MLNLKRFVLPMTLCALVVVSGAGCTRNFRKNRHLGKGEREFKAQHYDLAEIEYLNVLKVSPMNPVAIGQLGIIYQDEGKIGRAHAFLLKATELEPNNLEAHSKFALNSLAIGDYKTAIQQSLLVLSKQPGQFESLEVLSGCAVNSNALYQIQHQIQQFRESDQDRASYHIAFGNLALRRQDVVNAEWEFKRAWELDPKCASAQLGLGNIYWVRKDLQAADQALKSAADLSPIRSTKRLKYAQFLLMNGKTDAGKGILEQISKEAPDFVPAWSLLAQVAFGEKKYDDCFGYLQHVLARDPTNYEALMMRANVKLAQGDKTKALADLNQVADMYARVPQVQFELARLYVMNNDIGKAMGCLDKALTLNPNFPDAILLQANLNLRRGDVTTAILSLTELIKREPQLAQAHLVLIDAYIARRDLDQALAAARRMADLFPKAPDVRMLLGALLLRQNNTAEARQAFEKALELSPDYLPAIEQLVNLDMADNKFTAATARVQAAIDKYPKAPEPWVLMARIHLAKANAELDAENQKNPAAAKQKLLLADFPAAQGEVDQAEKALLKAIDINPDFRASYLMLADVYVASGKQRDALARLDSFLSKTNDVTALMQVGILHDSLKEYPAARDAYEKLLSVNPNFSPALNNLAYLYSERFNDLDKAYQMAEKARQLLPLDPATGDTLGWILYKRAEYTRAAGLLEESASKLPNENEVLFHLGMTDYMIGDEGTAQVALQKASLGTKEFPGKELIARRLAILAIDPKTADAAAVATLQQQVQDFPQDPVALERLGAIQERDGALDKAAATYEAALKSNPQNSALTLKLAELYSSSRVNDPQKALSLAKAAHDAAPDDPRISALLGRLVLQTGDSKWATSLLEESSRKLPADPQVAYDLAWAYYSLGRVFDARNLMQAAASAAGFSKADDAKRFLATVTAALDPAQARAYSDQAQQILGTDPNYVPALMVAALNQEAQGNYQPAADLYNKILARFSLFTPATRNLGLLYFAHLNDDQKAYDLATKARESFPQDPDVAKALGVLSYRKANYSRAAQLLQECAQTRKNDPELLYYLGMSQYQLKAKADSKATLQQALASNLPPKLAEDAKRVLAELK